MFSNAQADSNCPNCGAVVSINTAACPQCGGHLPEAGAPPAQPLPYSRWSKICAAAGLLCLTMAAVLPAVQAPDGPYRRTRCVGNLKTIGLALRAYHAQYGVFPPAYVADDQGRPMHSWRVLLLPFLDEQELYEMYDFSEPWDGEHNVTLFEKLPKVYACPAHHVGKSANTTYLALVGNRCAFRGTAGVPQADLPDGMANTVFVTEAAYGNIPWTRPVDLQVADAPKVGDRLFGFSSDHPAGVHFLMGDGTVRVVYDPEYAHR